MLNALPIAAVVYFVIVVPYNKLQARRARGEEPTPPSEEITLLTELWWGMPARSYSRTRAWTDANRDYGQPRAY
mgnify:CR=1 FL=1